MKKINIKKALGLAVVLGIFSMAYFCKNAEVMEFCSKDGLKSYISSYGNFAPLLYIILFTLVPLTLFPDALLAIAGGMVFGVKLGMIYTIIGASCGGALSFGISRYFGREFVEKLVKDKINWIEEGMEKRGFMLVFLLRLIPFIPFDLISYGVGLSKIKFKDFMLATVLGIIPGVFVYTNLGDKSGKVKSLEFLGALFILLLLMMVSYYVKKKMTLNSLQNKIMNSSREETVINE